MIFSKIIILVLLVLLAAAGQANCLANKLRGVNLAGAEFNSKNLPGKIFHDYTYPKESELQFIADSGANIIRLPFRWERIQPQIGDDLNSYELAVLTKTVSLANQYGLCVLLDIHNYAKYYGNTIGSNEVPINAFVDLWLKIANEFADENKTIFGLMNEPAAITVRLWAETAQSTITALRNRDVKNRIFTSGGHWSGVHNWFSDGQEDYSNGTAFANISDPLKRTTIEVHQYFDSYFSGTTTECLPSTYFTSMFETITQWATEKNITLFLGEFGVNADANCLSLLNSILSNLNDKAWVGWTYWAAGGWWGNYPFALNTDASSPSQQWNILKQHFIPLESISAPANVKFDDQSTSTL